MRRARWHQINNKINIKSRLSASIFQGLKGRVTGILKNEEFLRRFTLELLYAGIIIPESQKKIVLNYFPQKLATKIGNEKPRNVFGIFATLLPITI